VASWDGKIHCGEQMLTAGGGGAAFQQVEEKFPELTAGLKP